MKKCFLALVAVASLAVALSLPGDAQAFGGRSRVVVNNGGFNRSSVVVSNRGFRGQSVIVNNGGFAQPVGVQSFNSFQSFGGSCGFGARVLVVP